MDITNLPITNKEDWIHNSYFCTFKHPNGQTEEYDIEYDNTFNHSHSFWVNGDIVMLEGIEIIYEK